MIAAFISILIVVGVTSLGSTLKTFFQSLAAWV